MTKAIIRKPVIAIAVPVLLGILMLCLVACSKPYVIGTEAGDATKVSVKNETGQAITAVAVKSSLTEDFTDTLAQEGDWGNDVTATIYVSPQPAEAEDADAAGSDVILEPLIDIQVTTADGMSYVMHQLDISVIKDATLKVDDGTAYLVYKNASTNETVDTLGSELAYEEQLRQAEAARKAAEEQAAAEQAAAEQAAAEAEAARQSAARANSGESGSSGASSGRSSGSEDICVDDLILN